MSMPRRHSTGLNLENASNVGVPSSSSPNQLRLGPWLLKQWRRDGTPSHRLNILQLPLYRRREHQLATLDDTSAVPAAAATNENEHSIATAAEMVASLRSSSRPRLSSIAVQEVAKSPRSPPLQTFVFLSIVGILASFALISLPLLTHRILLALEAERVLRLLLGESSPAETAAAAAVAAAGDTYPGPPPPHRAVIGTNITLVAAVMGVFVAVSTSLLMQLRVLVNEMKSFENKTFSSLSPFSSTTTLCPPQKTRQRKCWLPHGDGWDVTVSAIVGAVAFAGWMCLWGAQELFVEGG